MKLVLFVIGLGFVPGLFFIVTANDPIVFQSLESETETGGPVFNRVKLISNSQKDIWLMQQSHNDFNNNHETWDRLAIVVDKSQKPTTAYFYQFKPGPLEFNENNETAPYRARCFACHVNGPRALLPNYASEKIDISLKNQIRIAFWNLKIKTYGNVQSEAGQIPQPKAPFKSSLAIMNQPLNLKSCTTCHSADGIRNELKLEHLGTAAFMVKNGFMPPFPFQISNEDRRSL